MKVNELDFITSDCGQTAFATMSFGQYEIFLGRSSWGAQLTFGQQCIILSRSKGVSKEQAIAICQSDFEARVMACVALSPSPSDVS